MQDRACFRVSVDEVAQDFAKFAALARKQTFEIWDDGEVEVLLVRIEAVRAWYDTLRICVPTALMSRDERAALLKSIEDLKNVTQWPD